MLDRLFRRNHAPSLTLKSRRAESRKRLDIQQLESRLALAYSASAVTLTTQPLTFGWNIVIDDAVDAQGYGRDLYMRRGDDASPYALIADNSDFRDAQRLPLLTTSGPATTFYVTTGGQQARVDGSLTPTAPVLPVLNPRPGVYTFDLPKENPLSISGTVVLAPGVSFGYSGVGLQANLPNALTLTVNNATNWGNAGLNTSPTGQLSTINGVSTLTFRLFDTNGAPINSPGNFDLINSPYLYFNPFPTQPFSFNVVAGQGFDQRLIVDLAGTGSRVSLQSPWSATRGDVEGDIPGVNRDPFFYSAYSGLDAVGQVCAYASEVSVAQFLGATSTIDIGDARGVSTRVTMAGDLIRGSTVISNLPASQVTNVGLNDFVSGPGIPLGTQVTAIDLVNSAVTLSAASAVNANTASITFTSARYSGYIGLPYALDVTAEMVAPALNVQIAGSESRDGSMTIAQSGRFTGSTTGAAASAVTVRGSNTNVYAEGWIHANSQNYILESTNAERQFDFTTRSRSTGANVGTLGGNTLAANLGSLGGTTFDVRTQIDQLRIDSGVDLRGRPYRNAITVAEVVAAANPTGDGRLTVNAVAASGGPITFATDSDLNFLGSAIRTSGSVAVDCGGTLSLPGTITSGNGDIAIRGPTLSATSVVAGGARAADLVAGQSVRLPTRVATAAGSSALNLTSAARLSVGMFVSGPGIAPNTTITGIGQLTSSVTLSAPTTQASASAAVFTFVSSQGDATIDAAIRAGGAVKELVRVATNMPLPTLAGLLVVDGVVVSAGDRVLVKNQASAAQNGIYVASTGSWVRAADAALSSQLVPGFVVFAENGDTQEGGWCFSNSTNPIVGETGLMFEPVTATRTYSPVRLATSSNISLLGTTPLVDGRQVNVGDRILVKNQINRAENGIYVVITGRWERADDADELTELTSGSFVSVQRSGITLNANLTASSSMITLFNTSNLRIGMLAEGNGVPAGTIVTTINSPTQVTLSQTATSTVSSSVTFTSPALTDNGLSGQVGLDGDLVSGSNLVTNVTGLNGLTADAVQVGMVVTGPGIAAGTTVILVNNAGQLTLSNPATASATATPLSFTANSTDVGSTVVGGLRSTTSLRPGMIIVGANIPGGALITAIRDAATIFISLPATGTATGTPLSFYEPSGLTNAGMAFALANNTVQVGATPLQFDPFAVQPTRTNFWSPQQVEPSVRVATTADVVLLGLQIIDGVAVQTGDRVLVKNQRNPVQNGIWVAQPSAWTRAAGGIARNTSVFVRDGASGGESTWLMNDTVRVMGQLTSASQIVRGITSTTGLIAGMLVMGPGIQTGTTIELVIDTNSLRLSKPPLTTDPNAIMSFMGVLPVVPGATPLTFVPAGGDSSVTAAGSIFSATALPTSRILGSTTLLTAGRRPDGQVTTTGVIDTRVTTGRISATAPESIAIEAAGALDVTDVRTTYSGGVVITAENMLMARSVIAASASSTPSPVSLASSLGDVVATTVTTPLGDVSLRADGEGRVVIVDGGPLSPGIAAKGGSIDVITDNGGIEVAGIVSAAGVGSDVAFRSSTNALQLLSTARVSANDQVIIVTPSGVVQVQPGAVVTTNRLAITAQFGTSQGPTATLGSFNAIEVNRTDPGNIVLSSPVALTVEGATAVAGTISISAPSLQVTGNVTAATAAPGDGDVQLTATAGNIDLGAPVTALGDRVTLNASAGVITQTAGQIDSPVLVWFATAPPVAALNGTYTITGPNLTAPGDLLISSLANPLVIAGASTVNGNIIVSAPSIQIIDIIRTGSPGNAVNVTASSGGIAFNVPNKRGIVSPSGSVTLNAVSGSVTSSKGTNPDVAGGPLTITTQSADLRTSVSSITAAVTSGPLTLSATNALALGAISASGQSVSLAAVSGVNQPTGGLVAANLAVTNGSGAVILTSPGNSVAGVSITNGSGRASFVNSGSFSVVAPGVVVGSPLIAGDGNISLKSMSGNIVLNGVVEAQQDRVTLDASAGVITQSTGQIDSQTLVWFATTQPSLAGTYNDIGSNLTGAGPLSLNVLSTQSVLTTSTVNGSITISGPSVRIQEPVTAGGVGSGITVSATGGNVALKTVLGSAPSLKAPNGLVSLSASGQVNTASGSVFGNSVAIVSGGTVLVGNVVASGTMSVATTTGGGVSVGPQVASLLQAGGALDLRNVQGPITISNGGRIVGNPLVLAPGQTIQFVGGITTVAELNSVINAVNQLPVTPGLTYDILVGASMTLTQTLTVNRPVTFRGTSTSIVLTGTSSVTNGLLLDSGAAGSTIRDIAFRNFSSNAIQAKSLSVLTISGVQVTNSGTGIRLSSVTNSTIGGTVAGQGNGLQSCGTGIYATGICTNTKLVKNTFPGTTTKYNVSTSRGITVVN